VVFRALTDLFALVSYFLKFHIGPMNGYIISPDPENGRLTETVAGVDHFGQPVSATVTIERPLTLFLNGQEIITMMTIGDHPDYLAVGFLLNQNMLTSTDQIDLVEFDEETDTVVVRTKFETDYEQKLKKKTRTSGCALGTAFGDMMEKFEGIQLDPWARVHTGWLQTLVKKINTTPSLYLKAGAIHGCILCERDTPLIYMEDVGRHNAVDKIAGYMFLNQISPSGKMFYTTGRLTSEMVIKTVQMNIPILISRSGFTAWGVDLARQAGLTLIGRARGARFTALSGVDRIIFDAPLEEREQTGLLAVEQP
jgi:FdhD protein